MNTAPLGPEDFDHLPVATLRDRIRALTEDQLASLREYETTHANRTGVLEIIDARLGQLRAGASPSPGSQSSQPERSGAPRGGSAVDESSAAEPSSPPPHGVPAQPARPKGDRQ